MASKPPIVTLAQALALSRSQSAALFQRHVDPPLARLLRLADADRRFCRGEGVYLYDDGGRRCLDLTGGYGALNLGHNPPEVLAAVRQAQDLPAVLLVGINPLQGALAQSLAAVLPGDLSLAVFGSGGAEAVENAMKTARAATGRSRFVSCRGGYHGLSFGALSICGSAPVRELMEPLLSGCRQVPFGDLAALEAALEPRDVAAFIVEPVQGEGGAQVPPPDYLAAAARLCKAHGSLLVFDEIQTGFGRTGRLFAMEHSGVVPDIVTLSKSLGSGVVPISVAVASEAVWHAAFGTRDRFPLTISTFGAHPAASAAGLKTIEILLRDDIAARARELGDHARGRLEDLRSRHELIKAIHGQGLLLGIELDTAGPFQAMQEENLAVMVIGELLHEHDILAGYYEFNPKVIRFEPPLIVSRDQIDAAIDALDSVLARSKRSLALAFGKTVVGGLLHR